MLPAANVVVELNKFNEVLNTTFVDVLVVLLEVGVSIFVGVVRLEVVISKVVVSLPQIPLQLLESFDFEEH